MTKLIEIKNNRPRLYTANGVELQPGLNKLPENEAEMFLNHPHIKIKIERGFIEVRGEVSLPVAKPPVEKPTEPEAVEPEVAEVFEEPPYGIQELNAEDSIAKIKVIEDVKYLKVVAAREDRKTVAIAAEKRIEELEG